MNNTDTQLHEIEIHIAETNAAIEVLMKPVNAKHEELRKYKQKKRDLLLSEFKLSIGGKLMITPEFYAVLVQRRWGGWELSDWDPGAILEVSGYDVDRQLCSVRSVSGAGITGNVTLGQITDMRNEYLKKTVVSNE